MEFKIRKVPLNGNGCKTLQDTKIQWSRCMEVMANIGHPNHNPNFQIQESLIGNCG